MIFDINVNLIFLLLIWLKIYYWCFDEIKGKVYEKILVSKLLWLIRDIIDFSVYNFKLYIIYLIN